MVNSLYSSGMIFLFSGTGDMIELLTERRVIFFILPSLIVDEVDNRVNWIEEGNTTGLFLKYTEYESRLPGFIVSLILPSGEDRLGCAQTAELIKVAKAHINCFINKSIIKSES